jgi:adenylate kinase family enzyme
MLRISTGALLRARQHLLPELAQFMDQGLLVPDELICQILKERLAELDAREKGVLLDGFPRTRRQAELLDELPLPISRCVLLDCPDWIVAERVEGRRTDPVSGRVYHVKFRPPSEPAVLARLIRRKDDTVLKVRTACLDAASPASPLLRIASCSSLPPHKHTHTHRPPPWVRTRLLEYHTNIASVLEFYDSREQLLTLKTR